MVKTYRPPTEAPTSFVLADVKQHLASFSHSAAISRLITRSSRAFTTGTNDKQCAAYRAYSLCLAFFGIASQDSLPIVRFARPGICGGLPGRS